MCGCLLGEGDLFVSGGVKSLISQMGDGAKNNVLSQNTIIIFLETRKYEPGHEKTGFLHMRKQRHRSASW